MFITHRYIRTRKKPPKITINKGNPQAIVGSRKKSLTSRLKALEFFRMAGIKKSLTNTVSIPLATYRVRGVIENQIKPVVFKSDWSIMPFFPNQIKHLALVSTTLILLIAMMSLALSKLKL